MSDEMIRISKLLKQVEEIKFKTKNVSNDEEADYLKTDKRNHTVVFGENYRVIAPLFFHEAEAITNKLNEAIKLIVADFKKTFKKQLTQELEKD